LLIIKTMLITALIKTVVYLVKNNCLIGLLHKLWATMLWVLSVIQMSKQQFLIMILTIKQCFYKVIEQKVF
jgi:hypothetical protein